MCQHSNDGASDDVSESKREEMLRFWSDRVKVYGADLRANTADVWLREIEIAHVDRVMRDARIAHTLDFGCANGYSTLRLAAHHPETQFLGLDINPHMIAAAITAAEATGLANIRFACRDVLADPPEGGLDFIYTIRVFQNLESPAIQERVLDLLCDLLKPGGRLLTIESYADGYRQLSDDRMALGLPPLPIHPHLTLLTDAFDAYAATRLEPLSTVSLSSSYYLVTRLLYAAMAKENGEAIDYDHPIHRIGALLPAIGDYGPQRARLWRKRG